MIIKCKMCGGTLEIVNGSSVAECEYCGTMQTLPRLNDERLANLYDRANHFRRNNEFDKAAGIYEQILNEGKTDAEAYWSLVLCRYGIEYVEDPATRKRIPTINRAQFTSVFDDDNYKSALAYADESQKAVYEAEAKAINEIQKGILAISQKEAPFDVFICYKETDNNGRRTPDSVLANELYHQLTQEGFKVFFSRITLEDKLGSAYEPYIFAALNSAKVMVVLGTRPEYFNAVWVKNEWSRYLALIRGGAKKLLIPAYRDMDPYNLPEEFSHLQAQDMSKLGFMQDLIRGIKKLAQAEEPKAVIRESIVQQSSNVTALLKRGSLALEDGEWRKADGFYEEVLNQDAECAEAYLGKLMAELQVRKPDALRDCAEPFDGLNNYKKALRFANEELRTSLTGCIEYINTRNENARLSGIYTSAQSRMAVAETEQAYKEAAKLFESIKVYKDSAVLANACHDKAEIERKKKEKKAKRNKKTAAVISVPLLLVVAVYFLFTNVIIPGNAYKDAEALLAAGKYDAAAAAFEELGDYKDAVERAAEATYNNAVALMDTGDIKAAHEIFTALGNYKDSADIAVDLALKIALKEAKAGDYVIFGAYEQDNNTANGKEEIEWLVLEVKDGKALVISKYALDCMPYNTISSDQSWETCSLRKWLNNNFIYVAFSDDEKAIISTVTVSADKNPEYGTNPGKATQDRVFLPSITEANKYFSSYSARRCQPTDYAVAMGARESDNGNCQWWLRSPGNFQDYAAYVGDVGGVSEHGYNVYGSINGNVPAIRPAMWIDLSLD